MTKRNWSVEKFDLPLRFDWKISRGSSQQKTIFILRIQQGKYQGLGEVAFNKRYGESEESIDKGLKEFIQKSEKISRLEDLLAFMEELKLDYSLRFGIESAWTRLEARIKNVSVARYLGLKEVRSVKSSFSLPIMETGQIAEFIESLQLKRFSTLKVKVNENAVETVREVAKHYSGPLRIDPNEVWTDPDQVLRFIEAIKGIELEFLEQPLPAGLDDELLYLKKKSSVVLVADESLTHEGVTSYHADRFHGVNVKLMKAGGFVPALNQLRKARELGMKTMLGCMIETSVGISAAMELAQDVNYLDLDGFLLLKEDPFGLVREAGGELFLTT